MDYPKIPNLTLDKLREILVEDDPVRLKSFLEDDDSVRLKAFLEDDDSDVLLSEYPEVMRECLLSGAKKCAFLMLSGDVLRQALQIHMCDPVIVEVLFKHFGSERYANSLTGFGAHPRLPLWAQTDLLSSSFSYLLCEPQLRKKLHCLRLLANYTHSLPKVAASFLTNGDVVELAALLLVAHPLLLHHLKACHFENHPSTMKDTNEMVSWTAVGKFPNPSGFGLIEIF
ncbi:hypothetical protein DM860_016609 [Cuscuta australis]|uniref:Uncharacterized protein n=1 Tax=Cuscuta australis TaxID=267555 RepID=A0A328DL07_9ASTE|nr:hypothetical protein DM860_016609 [Cuscuta australis]